MDPRIPLTEVVTSIDSAWLRQFQCGRTVLSCGRLYDLLGDAAKAHREADIQTIEARCTTHGQLDEEMLQLVSDPIVAASSVPGVGNVYRDPETRLVAYRSSPIITYHRTTSKAFYKRDDMDDPPPFADDEVSRSRWTMLYETLDQQRYNRLDRTRPSVSLYLVRRGQRTGWHPVFCCQSGLMERADLHPYMVRILQEMQEHDDSFNILTVDLDSWSQDVSLEGPSGDDIEQSGQGDEAPDEELP